MSSTLYLKENKDLINVIDKYTGSLVFTMQMKEVIEILSAAKAPKEDGKGNSYIDRVIHHMPLLKQCKWHQEKYSKEHLNIKQ